jgi:hypothetical protein
MGRISSLDSRRLPDSWLGGLKGTQIGCEGFEFDSPC